MFRLPDFMAPLNKRAHNHRPRPLQSSKSSSQVEPASPSRTARDQHPSKPQNGQGPQIHNNEATDLLGTPAEKNQLMMQQPDVFEKSTDEDEHHEAVEGLSGRVSVDCDDLPIELISLTDRCVESPRCWIEKDQLLTGKQFYRIPIRQGSPHSP